MRSRSAGTGSCSGRATSSSAPVAAGRPGERVHQQLQAHRQRERLVRLLTAKGDDVLGPGRAGQHIAQVRPGHRDVGDDGAPSLEGMAMASGHVLASAGPPSGGARRGGEVAVIAQTRPPSASLRS